MAGIFLMTGLLAVPSAFCQEALSFVELTGELGLSDSQIKNGSLTGAPDFSRIQQVFSRAERGEDLVIGAIGGSITMGAAAGVAPEDRWINLVARWFQMKFPEVDVYLYNAGIGATNSKFGALRAQHDLLQYEPDMVFFEFSVNDNVNDMVQEGSEGLLRQALHCTSEPGIIMLGMMNRWGDNVQEKHLPLASHYDIPFISLRNLCESRITSGQLDPRLILADDVHPHTAGHRLTARMILLHLEEAFSQRSRETEKTTVIPEPLYSDMLEKVVFHNAAELSMVVYSGWQLQEHAVTRDQHWRLHGKRIIEKVWNAVEPGSEWTLAYEGTFFAITHYLYQAGAGAGTVSVKIDGVEQGVIRGEGEQTWGGYHQTRFFGQELSHGEHLVTITLTEGVQQDDGSAGFGIIAVSYGTE